MLHQNRVLIKTSGVLSDLSVNLSEIHSAASTIVLTATDALYLGSDFPFNHRYIEIGTANDQAAEISVSTWSGTEWIPAVDVIDQTAVGGKCLAQSGIISWVPDRDSASWMSQLRSSDISDLSTTKIYDLYWVKITVDASLKASTSLKYVGHKFSTDAHLGIEYPDLIRTDLMTAFESGKTDWLKQTISAAEYIIQDLREKGVVVSDNQILDWTTFQKASVHKTAEIICSAFGEDYKEMRALASGKYSKSLNIKAFNVDQNKDATLNEREKTPMTGYLTR